MREEVRGVIAIITANDIDAAGVGNVDPPPAASRPRRQKLVMPNRPALARERVMYVGEPVAMVVAETALAAQDAAELVAVDYEEIDAGDRHARAAQRPARRNCGRRRRATSRSTGRAPPRSRANAQEVERIIASRQARRARRASTTSSG